MPIIGSTITGLDQLKHYSGDSTITTQKNLFGKGESLVVLDGYLSRGLYAIRAAFQSAIGRNTIQEENDEAVRMIKDMIAKDGYYGKGVTDSRETSFSETSSDAEQETSSLLTATSLTVASLRPKELEKSRTSAEKRERDAFIKTFPQDQRKLARVLFDHHFQVPSGRYRLPDDKQKKELKQLVDQAKDSRVDLEKITSSVKSHIERFPQGDKKFTITPKIVVSPKINKKIDGAILEALIKRAKAAANFSDPKIAQDIYDDFFLNSNGTYETPTEEDLKLYQKTTRENLDPINVRNRHLANYENKDLTAKVYDQKFKQADGTYKTPSTDEIKSFKKEIDTFGSSEFRWERSKRPHEDPFSIPSIKTDNKLAGS